MAFIDSGDATQSIKGPDHLGVLVARIIILATAPASTSIVHSYSHPTIFQREEDDFC